MPESAYGRSNETSLRPWFAHRCGAIAVVVVQAFAGAAIIRIVVVSLIGRHRLLVDEIRDPPFISDDKRDVVLIDCAFVRTAM